MLGALWQGATRAPLESDVRASRRRRMLAAMVEAVAETGYAAVTVSDITSRARVSPATFYEEFADTSTCFLAAVEACGARLASTLETAAPAHLPPRQRLCRFVGRMLDELAASPDIARVCLVESLAAGPPAMALRQELHAGAAAQLRGLHETLAAAGEPVRPVTDVDLEALAGAIITLVTHRLASGDPAALRPLHAPMVAIVLTHFGLPPP